MARFGNGFEVLCFHRPIRRIDPRHDDCRCQRRREEETAYHPRYATKTGEMTQAALARSGGVGADSCVGGCERRAGTPAASEAARGRSPGASPSPLGSQCRPYARSRDTSRPTIHPRTAAAVRDGRARGTNSCGGMRRITRGRRTSSRATDGLSSADSSISRPGPHGRRRLDGSFVVLVVAAHPPQCIRGHPWCRTRILHDTRAARLGAGFPISSCRRHGAVPFTNDVSALRPNVRTARAAHDVQTHHLGTASAPTRVIGPGPPPASVACSNWPTVLVACALRHVRTDTVAPPITNTAMNANVEGEMTVGTAQTHRAATDEREIARAADMPRIRELGLATETPLPGISTRGMSVKTRAPARVYFSETGG